MNNDAQQSCVFIIGMHRSGTSALAGCLDILGLNLGTQLLPPTIDNPKGYFEKIAVNELNDKILAALNHRWHTPFIFDDTMLSEEKSKSFINECQQLLATELKHTKQIVIKDPRISVLLPFWQKACEKIGLEAKYIICLRNPAEIKESIQKRDHLTSQQIYIIWLNYLFAAEKNTRHLSRFFINFDLLLKEPLNVLDQLSKNLPLSFQYDLQDSTSRINAFLEPSLKHFNKTESILPPKVSNLYSELIRLSQSDKDYNLLDNLRMEYIEENQFYYYKHITDNALENVDEPFYYTTQICVDSGNGFNHTATLRKKIDKKTTSIKFDLSQFDNIERIRFDPINTYAFIQIQKISIQKEHDTWVDIPIFYANALRLDDDHLLFDSKFPQVLLDIKPHEPQSIRIDLNYLQVGKSMLPKIIDEFKNDKKIQSNKIIEFQSYINQRDHQLNESKKSVAHLKEIITSKEEIIANKEEIITSKYEIIANKEDIIANKEDIIVAKGNELEYIKNLVQEKQNQINALNFIVQEREKHIAALTKKRTELARNVQGIQNSLSNRLGRILTFPMRWVYDKAYGNGSTYAKKQNITTNKANIITPSKSTVTINTRDSEPLVSDASKINLQFRIGNFQEHDYHIALRGWIFSDKKISKLSIKVENGKEEKIYNVYYPQDRIDVYRYYKHPNAFQSGFDCKIPKELSGKCTLSFVIETDDQLTINANFVEETLSTPSTHKYKDAIATNRQRFEAQKSNLNLKKIAVYTSSLGNYFFNEIKLVVMQGFKDLGFEVIDADENKGFLSDIGMHIIVAPHEFYTLGLGEALKESTPFNTIIINTEQSTSQWFDKSLVFFQHAFEVWDMNYHTYNILKKDLEYVQFIPLGYSKNIKHLNEVTKLPTNQFTIHLEDDIKNNAYLKSNFVDRPIDILFVGHASEKRQNFFAKNAALFSNYNCYFHLTNLSGGPVVANDPKNLNTETAIGLAQRAKIVLNIHHSNQSYFEWHRIIMHGIWQRALVVSESSDHCPYFESGIDFVSADTEQLAALIEYHLNTTKGQQEAQQIIDSAYNKLTQNCIIKEELQEITKNYL